MDEMVRLVWLTEDEALDCPRLVRERWSASPSDPEIAMMRALSESIGRQLDLSTPENMILSARLIARDALLALGHPQGNN